jgi:hypothetical protein
MDAATFASGKTWTEYMDSVEKNRDRFEELFVRFAPTEADLAAFGAVPSLRIVAVGEDWCPDVFNTLGIVAKIAAATPGAQLRIFERDSRPEIMDLFLSSGKKRIPVVAFHDADFRLLGWWAGRNREADAWVSGFRKGRPYDQIPAEEMDLFRGEFDRRYRESWGRGNLEEIKAALAG